MVPSPPPPSIVRSRPPTLARDRRRAPTPHSRTLAQDRGSTPDVGMGLRPRSRIYARCALARDLPLACPAAASRWRSSCSRSGWCSASCATHRFCRAFASGRRLYGSSGSPGTISRSGSGKVPCSTPAVRAQLRYSPHRAPASSF
jgi:hypothetical protein